MLDFLHVDPAHLARETGGWRMTQSLVPHDGFLTEPIEGCEPRLRSEVTVFGRLTSVL